MLIIPCNFSRVIPITNYFIGSHKAWWVAALNKENYDITFSDFLLILSLFTPQMLRDVTISRFSGVTENIQIFLLDEDIIVPNAIDKSEKQHYNVY